MTDDTHHGPIPQAVRELLTNGHIAEREARAAARHADAWRGPGGYRAHNAMADAIGKHAFMVEMLMLGHLSVREIAKVLEMAEAHVTKRAALALTALADFYGE